MTSCIITILINIVENETGPECWPERARVTGHRETIRLERGPWSGRLVCSRTDSEGRRCAVGTVGTVCNASWD